MRHAYGRLTALVLGSTLMAGCATYHPKPLPTKPDLRPVSALTAPTKLLDLPGLHPAPFDPIRGLDETTLIALAVVNNPELRAERLQAGVAEAQLLAAGLLPDPRLDAGLSRSSRFVGYDATLSEDIRALVMHGARKARASTHAKQVNLQILWGEWQVAERARELFIQADADRQLRHILDRQHQILAELNRRDQVALEKQYVPAGVVTADFAALTAVDEQWRALTLRAIRTRHDLDLLLGLRPNTRLHLRAAANAQMLTAAAFRSAVKQLPHRRPDLLALQAGYLSEEQRLREAILAQFPALSLGIAKARSPEEGVQTVGIAFSLTLPLFNRNRGEIAIQNATRDVLYQTYQARLDQSVTDADRVWRAEGMLAKQLREAEQGFAPLERTEAAARRSVEQGSLDLASYVRVETNILSAHAQIVRLRASLRQNQAELAMLLALPFGDDEGHR